MKTSNQILTVKLLRSVNLPLYPSPLREKVAKGRMRGMRSNTIRQFPLTLALSLMERGYILIQRKISANQDGI